MTAGAEKVALASYDLAEEHRKAGRTADAVIEYRRSIHMWESIPDYGALPPAPYYRLAAIHKKEGRTALAREILERHVRLCPRGHKKIHDALAKLGDTP